MKKMSFVLGILALGFLYSCQKSLDASRENMPMSMAKKGNNYGTDFRNVTVPFYALADDNRLDYYSLETSAQALQSVTITGLQDGERLLAIDFRPATGQLYGLGSSSRLYVINLLSGTARPVGAGSFSPGLSGSLVGFDFNPTVDRIRVVTSSGQNLRLHPETGVVVFTDGALNGAPGATIAGAAYTNNEAGATATTLYDIDVASDKLYRQDPPNNGTLVEVGELGADLQGQLGFDIAPSTYNDQSGYVALALQSGESKSTLYRVDLNTGKTKKVEKFEKNVRYYSLAIPTNPVAYAVRMNSLLIFNLESSAAPVAKTLTGLQSGETIVGIDFRPANGALYALGSSGRLYTLNTASGAATLVGTLSIPLQGTSFGFDFNPVPDRIRIVSNSGQNLRVNPVDAVAVNDGAINPAPASVTAAAYTNNFAGTTTTQLYVIDTDNSMVYLQAPPNNGTLTNGKPLGISIDASNGFDIGGTSNKAYGLFTAEGQTKLYAVDLMTGMATAVNNFSGPVSGFALGLGF